LFRLGGARAINRRYISDHVPVKQLTSASAAFVSASALGMAVGPALAGVLSKLDFKVLNPLRTKMPKLGLIFFLPVLMWSCVDFLLFIYLFSLANPSNVRTILVI